jgi:hypothetical protein
MKIARLSAEDSREIELNTFDCAPCGVSYTTAAQERPARIKD